jgi:16S rRNA C967 or C1407 C5-methylase (RsmB/RsmF family)/predicted ribosome-associated RNA-binding protein Tma20
MDDLLIISSLADLSVELPKDIKEHLKDQYRAVEKDPSSRKRTRNEDDERGNDHLNNVLEAMKLPPQVTTCRVNLLLSSVDDVLRELNQFLTDLAECKEEKEGRDAGASASGNITQNKDGIILDKVLFQAQRHNIFHDVIEIRPAETFCNVAPLTDHSSAPRGICHEQELFSNRPLRQKSKFPLHHKVVICDRLCGEAVLRGSNIFVRGVIAADKNIISGEKVCVYAHVEKRSMQRGMTVETYYGHCVFLGLGEARCSRADMFIQESGLAVSMFNSIAHSLSGTQKYSTRAGPLSPPMNGILSNKMMLQNLPSILVAHVLEPREADIIADLCCCPGGKTSHVASLVKNNATIVAMDKSRKKVKSVKTFFENVGASCITPLALDSTKCVLDGKTWMSVKDILSSATPCESDGLLNVKGFHPASFDKIVLDPPCSALGLRPKLCIEIKSLKDLNKHADYQRKFVRSAVSLLKNGGTLVYSTCTINSSENEKMVRHILDNYESMKLVPIDVDIGLPGLPGCDLNDDERHKVRRFDPSDAADTMGFFVAKFQKNVL